MPTLTTLEGQLVELVRRFFRTSEVERYFATKLTPPRAQVVAGQFGLFVRNRRDCWAFVAGGAPYDVKKLIAEHEYEELILDERAKGDHYSLWVRQGMAVGLTRDQMDNAEPLPTTLATTYAWLHIAKSWPWLDAVAASGILEWTNDDRYVEGGALATRSAKRWMGDLGFTEAQIPNFVVHREADVEHGSMTTGIIERYGTSDGDPARVVRAATMSLSLFQVFLGGLADAMARV
jgi:pyrroloquinoline quinone (PQQ) biosynthesis protein C